MEEMGILNESYITFNRDQERTLKTLLNGQEIDCSVLTTGELEFNPYYVATTGWEPVTIREKYVCPSCGKTFIMAGAGFVPNCENCGTVMVEEG